jgi:DNA-directed RNA polymerase subunit RPC12/RpoP
MTNFVCKNCGYQFEAEEGKKCPYCGKKRIEKEKSAKDLVKDIKVR